MWICTSGGYVGQQILIAFIVIHELLASITISKQKTSSVAMALTKMGPNASLTPCFLAL